MYRDDADAARARVDALTAQLKSATAELALYRAGGCGVPEHAGQVARLAQLEKSVATQRAHMADRTASPHRTLEDELMRLRVELADLQLLADGPEVIEERLAECQRAIDALELAAIDRPAPGPAPGDGDWVWVPRRTFGHRAARWVVSVGAAIGGGALVAAAIATGVVPAVVGGIALAFGGATLIRRKHHEDALLLAQTSSESVAGVRWSDVDRIRFERDPARIVIEAASRSNIVYRANDIGYARVIEHARTAAAIYGIVVVGEFPRLLAGGG